ncbi:hypothetical protein PLIP_a1957 [Pseudoalteromonas lipolytica LMEB 39]|nr:hypothetical protein [Pseudoalteromonas lipolytica LMEB 39]
MLASYINTDIKKYTLSHPVASKAFNLYQSAKILNHFE